MTNKFLNTKKMTSLGIFALLILMSIPVSAAGLQDQINSGIRQIYLLIVGISTGAAVLFTAIAALVCRMSKNQKTVDDGWDWIKRVWVSYLIINGLGFIATFVSGLVSGGTWAG